jgi:hypothetical protein
MGSLYRSQHELIFAFKDGKASHHNNIPLGQFGRYRTNVWDYPGLNSFARSTEEGNLQPPRTAPNANRDAVDERERLRVFREHGSEHA